MSGGQQAGPDKSGTSHYGVGTPGNLAGERPILSNQEQLKSDLDKLFAESPCSYEIKLEVLHEKIQIMREA
jgi:hypothetical protein